MTFVPLASSARNSCSLDTVPLSTATTKPWSFMFRTRFWPITARPMRPMSAGGVVTDECSFCYHNRTDLRGHRRPRRSEESGTRLARVFGDLEVCTIDTAGSILLAYSNLLELADTWPPELNDQPPAGRKAIVAAPAHPGSAGDCPGFGMTTAPTSSNGTWPTSDRTPTLLAPGSPRPRADACRIAEMAMGTPGRVGYDLLPGGETQQRSATGDNLRLGRQDAAQLIVHRAMRSATASRPHARDILGPSSQRQAVDGRTASPAQPGERSPARKKAKPSARGHPARRLRAPLPARLDHPSATSAKARQTRRRLL